MGALTVPQLSPNRPSATSHLAACREVERREPKPASSRAQPSNPETFWLLPECALFVGASRFSNIASVAMRSTRSRIFRNNAIRGLDGFMVYGTPEEF